MPQYNSDAQEHGTPEEIKVRWSVDYQFDKPP